MKKIYLFFVTFFVIFIFNTSVYNQTVLDILEDDFIIGDENAPVTIIEYASLSCSHCADFHFNTLNDLKKEYIDTGKAKMVFRNLGF